MNRSVVEMFQYTLCQFCWQFDSFVINAWDHTAIIAAEIEKFSVLVHNMITGGQRHPAKHYREFNLYSPEIGSSSSGKITQDNFHVLKLIGKAMIRR